MKKYLTFIFLILSTAVYSQSIIRTSSGTVCEGGSDTYSVSGGRPFDSYSWSVGSGGSVNGSSSNMTVTIDWTGGGTVSVYVTYNGSNLSHNESVTYDPNGGSVTGPSSTCYNTSPGTLSVSGGGSGTYQWQKWTGSSWSNISGATSSTYNPGVITSTTKYRRKTTNSCGTGYTSQKQITVYSDLLAGSIGGTQSICEGDTPSTFTNMTSASQGDSPNYNYQWQSKVGAGSWTDISGASSVTYMSTSISEDTDFRREVTSGNCAAKYSNTISVTTTVPDPLDAAEHEVMQGDTITLTSDSHYSYQWTLNGADISGATGITYHATDTGKYRVNVKCSATSPVFSSDSVVLISRFAQQSDDYNYIYTINIFKEGVTEVSQISSLSKDELIQEVSYLDGLGRNLQSIVLGTSPEGMDMVSPVEYDDYGRVEREYLPYARDAYSGHFGEYALDSAGAYYNSKQYDFYQIASNIAHDTKPYTESVFEASPLGRVIEQGAPGVIWNPSGDNTQKMEYLVNLESDSVRLWDTSGSLPESTEKYDEGELQKNTIEDEDGNITRTYVDKMGNTILKESKLDATTWASTYWKIR